ncbi:MAG: histidine kinase [Oscillospiraceae bacterium]|nr:histidine kinase [Oscillospiraceae bacterium]
MILAQKALFIIMAIIMMLYTGISLTTVCIIVLVSVTLTYLDYYFNNMKYKLAYTIIGLLLIALNNYFIYLIPSFIFDTLNRRTYYLSFLIFIPLMLSLDLPGYSKITLLLLSITSAIINLFANKFYTDKKKILTLEDDYSELESKSVLQNKQLLESQDNEVYYATLNERARISREIHDNVGHILSSSIIQLGAIKKLNKEESIAPLLDGLDTSLNDGMNSIRHSVHNIHAKSFDLKKETQSIIDNYLFCPVVLNYSLNETTPTKIKITILSIIKEALNNTSKHSNSSLIKITVRELEQHIQVTIFDNGTTSTVNNFGIGLISMQDRIELLNGIINVSNNDGFRIHITIPKQAKHQQIINNKGEYI